jgi:hypothetical protein
MTCGPPEIPELSVRPACYSFVFQTADHLVCSDRPSTSKPTCQHPTAASAVSKKCGYGLDGQATESSVFTTASGPVLMPIQPRVQRV